MTNLRRVDRLLSWFGYQGAVLGFEAPAKDWVDQTCEGQFFKKMFQSSNTLIELLGSPVVVLGTEINSLA